VSELRDPEARASTGPAAAVGRLLVAFGRFWWEFLIGDTPELFVGGVVAVGLVAAICVDHRLRMVAGVALVVLVALLLTGSVAKAARAARRES